MSELRLWGVRGSIPTPLTTERYREKITRVLELAVMRGLTNIEDIEQFILSLAPAENSVLGGNTSCMEVVTPDGVFIIDMGSGFRELGNKLLAEKTHTTLNIFNSHLHWDHIQGLPFFTPAYNSDFTLNFHAVHEGLQSAIEDQQQYRYFPVSVDYMQAKKHFVEITENTPKQFGATTITAKKLYHPGDSYSYRIDTPTGSVVYASDGEYKDVTPEHLEEYIQFYKNADFLLFDAQYSSDQIVEREDWGHSYGPLGIDIAVRAGVKILALSHHDPDNSDFDIERLYEITVHYQKMHHPHSPLKVFIAREGDSYSF